MRVFHARLHASSGKNTALKRCPSCPFVLNGLVLSLLTLKRPFWPVLWTFCPVLCPFWPSHKLLKFTGTVYDTTFVVNLTHNDSDKRQKCHIIALCFSLTARGVSRVVRQTTSHDSSQPMIYLQTIITFFLKFFYRKKKIYKDFKYLTEACWLRQP